MHDKKLPVKIPIKQLTTKSGFRNFLFTHSQYVIKIATAKDVMIIPNVIYIAFLFSLINKSPFS